MRKQNQYLFEYRKQKPFPTKVLDKLKGITLSYDSKIEELKFQKDIKNDENLAPLVKRHDKLVADLTKLLQDIQLERNKTTQKITDQINSLKEEKFTKLLEVIKK